MYDDILKYQNLSTSVFFFIFYEIFQQNTTKTEYFSTERILSKSNQYQGACFLLGKLLHIIKSLINMHFKRNMCLIILLDIAIIQLKKL